MSKYQMTVGLSVLDPLGINLYSNAAAVLSELVANAYDADATRVEIEWGTDETVIIRDNGSGMNVQDINERFLLVGYRKRDEANEGKFSPVFNRPFMGRKGIGKLSVFSIANFVTVYSTKSDETNAFSIDVSELQEKIETGATYAPDEVADADIPDDYRRQGTCIVLTSLRSKRADLTAKALRKRIARRFDVVSQTPPEEGGFSIVINGNAVNWADRQELKNLQFIWEFGTPKLDQAYLPSDIERFELESTVNEQKGWKVRGWFGTATQPTDLTSDEDAGSLKNIIVLARKRPIQEGIIEKLDFSRVFGNYVTGQIEADFLDDDDLPDIATSDRQRLIEDDERVLALQRFLRKAFVSASDTWSRSRPKKSSRDAMDRYPKIREWVDGLDSYQKPFAEKMVGTIAALDFEDRAEEQRTDLFRSGILAFARVGLRKATDDLESLSNVTATDILPILGRQSDYESALWTDILRSRIEAIENFQSLTDGDEKERVLQGHLFDNLWLLDASWERATGSPRMEQSLKRMAADDFDFHQELEGSKDRVDIRYASTSGKHIIVELKRYSASSDIDSLKFQGGKYAAALNRILVQQQDPNPDIEVVFVLGSKPRLAHSIPGDADSYIETSMAQIRGRIVYYDALINNALAQYDEYLGASASARKLDELLSSIETPTSDAVEGASRDGGVAPNDENR